MVSNQIYLFTGSADLCRTLCCWLDSVCGWFWTVHQVVGRLWIQRNLFHVFSYVHCRSYDQPRGRIIRDDVFNVYYDHYSFDLAFSPYLYWGWTVSIGGPVVYLLAVAHAVMWTRISSILGSVVSKSVLTDMGTAHILLIT